MKHIIVTVTASALTLGAWSAAIADDKIAERKENHQDRIADGVENGKLSPRETAHLENQETNWNKEIHTDRKQNRGNLTNKQKAQVNRQHRLSREIYRAKHDGAGK